MGEVKVKRILIVIGVVSSIILLFGFVLVFSIKKNNTPEYSNWVSVDDYIVKEVPVYTDDVTVEEITVTIASNTDSNMEEDSEIVSSEVKNISLTQNTPADKIIENSEVYIAQFLDENGEPLTPTTADELVEWAHRAYDEEWTYAYGGCQEGLVDCSGLIKSRVYVCARGTEELLAESENKGSIDTIPDIPGLGVYMFGHVGIYVGGGMVIDARTEVSGIGYDAIDYEGWTDWFEIKGVDYSKYMVSE